MGTHSVIADGVLQRAFEEATSNFLSISALKPIHISTYQTYRGNILGAHKVIGQ